MRGLGKDVAFLRALVTLRVNPTIVIEGLYAVRWLEFMEWKMGLRPVQESLRRSHKDGEGVSEWNRGDYSVKLERLVRIESLWWVACVDCVGASQFGINEGHVYVRM